jgi:hypothetical protein
MKVEKRGLGVAMERGYGCMESDGGKAFELRGGNLLRG